MIDIDTLTVRFGDFTAVNGLTLQVGAGELFGFLGPNGAGKTTTMRVLTGALHATSGRVRIAGFDMPRELKAIKPLVGYVPDTENHYEDFSGRQNLELFARLYGVDTARVMPMLRAVELDEAADVRVRGYSKGMKKKLLIARELLHEPRLVFFDEPTAHLDAHSVRVVRRLLRDLVSRGVTVFLTTHDMQEVEDICDRVAILSRGRLIACDPPSAFIARHAENRVEAQYEEDGQTQREVLHLDEAVERARLAQIVMNARNVRVHSREFSFEDVFRRLTGETYR